MTTDDGGRSWRRRRAPAVLSATLLVLMALSRGREAAAQASTTGPGGARPPAAGAAVWDSVVIDPGKRGLRNAQLVGRLPHPLKWYAERGDAFYRLVRDKGWYGHARQRRCEDCPAGRMTKMQVQAITNLHRDHLDKLPRNGLVVGRMMNIGDFTDATTHVSRGGPHPDQWYFVITGKRDRGAGTSKRVPVAASMWVARVRFDSTGHPIRKLETIRAMNDFVKCPNSHVEPVRTASDGDFRDCPGAPASSLPQRRPGEAMESGGLSPMLHLAAFRTPDAPLQSEAIAFAWFSCDGGCCSAKWPP